MSKVLSVIAGLAVFACVFLTVLNSWVALNTEVKSLRTDVIALQKQAKLYEEALQKAEADKAKIGEEYAEKKEQLKQIIENNDLLNSALPDDVVRLLKENSRRTANVPAASNVVGRDKNTRTGRQ